MARRERLWLFFLCALGVVAGGYGARRGLRGAGAEGGALVVPLDRPVEADSGAHKGPGIELVPEPEYLEAAPAQK
jgi:hypothetical protein